LRLRRHPHLQQPNTLLASRGQPRWQRGGHHLREPKLYLLLEPASWTTCQVRFGILPPLTIQLFYIPVIQHQCEFLTVH
jgi:hypothetical protein